MLYYVAIYIVINNCLYMFKEGSQSLEQNPSSELESITSFEELYDFIKDQGEIQGTRKKYTSDDLIKIIERVRHGHRPIEWVTNTKGIRDIVEQLLVDDKVYLKYTQGSKFKKK